MNPRSNDLVKIRKYAWNAKKDCYEGNWAAEKQNILWSIWRFRRVGKWCQDIKFTRAFKHQWERTRKDGCADLVPLQTVRRPPAPRSRLLHFFPKSIRRKQELQTRSAYSNYSLLCSVSEFCFVPENIRALEDIANDETELVWMK